MLSQKVDAVKILIEIKKKLRKVDGLAEIEKQLNAKIKNQELRIKELEIASSPKSITIRNRAIELKGIVDARERQIYDYSIWLEVPILLEAGS